MEALFALAAFTVYPLVLLSPMTRLLRRFPKPDTKSRFSVSDLLALMFLVQVPIGYAKFLDVANNSDGIIFQVILMVVATIAWLAGLLTANHLGVTNQWKRIVVIGFTIPCAIVGGCVFPFATLGALFLPSPWPLFAPIGFCFFTFLIYRTEIWVIDQSALKLAADYEAYGSRARHVVAPPKPKEAANRELDTRPDSHPLT